ncbi:MAG: hypothetical protein WBV55_15140 [Candidatus Sulfotelmatobacter sp.]
MGLTGLPGVFGFYKSLQVGEVHLPEVAVLLDPGIDGTKRFGIQLIDAVTTFAMLAHEVCTAEKAQVFGDGGAGDGEGLGDFSGGLAAAAEQIEDGAAGRVG